ncbi:MAG: hypothetical protein ACRCYP_01375 [Alphaproteobacteria bacterium]
MLKITHSGAFERPIFEKCVLCGKKAVHKHHILGRGGLTPDNPLKSKTYSGFLKNNPKMQVPVCFQCHSLEKGLNVNKRREFLQNAFKAAGGVIIGQLWQIQTSIGLIYAPSGHNSAVIFLKEKIEEISETPLHYRKKQPSSKEGESRREAINKRKREIYASLSLEERRKAYLKKKKEEG